MYRILFVEDDKNIREMVCDYLTGEAFEVDALPRGDAVSSMIRQKEYHLILLDLMLPDCSGMDVIKAVRKVSTVPIIIVTAKDNDTDKAIGLNLGADDYVVKPFSLMELTARIRANIRRTIKYDGSGSFEDNILHIRNLEIDTMHHTARLGGCDLQLTHTEFEILKLLAASPGTAFSKEQLYTRVWKEPYYGNENALNTHMNRLRGKLKAADPAGKELIRTLWGIGYKLEDN